MWRNTEIADIGTEIAVIGADIAEIGPFSNFNFNTVFLKVITSIVLWRVAMILFSTHVAGQLSVEIFMGLIAINYLKSRETIVEC